MVKTVAMGEVMEDKEAANNFVEGAVSIVGRMVTVPIQVSSVRIPIKDILQL